MEWTKYTQRLTIDVLHMVRLGTVQVLRHCHTSVAFIVECIAHGRNSNRCAHNSIIAKFLSEIVITHFKSGSGFEINSNTICGYN